MSGRWLIIRLLSCSWLGSAQAAELTGNRVVDLAFTHDYELSRENTKVHLLRNARTQFDEAGLLRRFDENNLGAVSWGEEQPVGHAGNDAIIAWGRWGQGHIGGVGAHGNFDITGGEGSRNGLHYVAGAPFATKSAAPPTGSAYFSVLGGNVGPTAGEGGMAVVTSIDRGTLKLDFDRKQVEVKLTITVPSGTYEVQTSGLKLDGGYFELPPNGSATVTGTFCFAGCKLELRGFLAGSKAQRAGIAYHIDIGVLSQDIAGVVAWTRKEE